MTRRGSLALASAIAIGLALGLGAFTFVYAKGASYLTNDPAACANCHVMREHFDAWNKGSHRHAATCNDCHTPHDNVVARYYTKALNGFWHSFYFTTGRYPDPLRITPRNHRVTESACRSCHGAIVEAIDPQVGRRAGARPPALAVFPVTPLAPLLLQDAARGGADGGREGGRTTGTAHGGTSDQDLSCVRCHKYVGHWVR